MYTSIRMLILYHEQSLCLFDDKPQFGIFYLDENRCLHSDFILNTSIHFEHNIQIHGKTGNLPTI